MVFANGVDRKITEVYKVRQPSAFQIFVDARIIEQVMSEDDHKSEEKDKPERQLNDEAKKDHTDSNRPNDLQNEKIVERVKGPGKRYDE